MSFWSGYWASLKPREVEETIDVYVHRPLAYLLTRAIYRLPISPDVVTGLSILAGIASAVSLLASFPHHLQVSGLLLFFSAVLDCADGQLARMRGTSSISMARPISLPLPRSRRPAFGSCGASSPHPCGSKARSCS
jgi:hypothetical protein